MGEEDLLDYDDSEFADETENNDPPDQTGQAEGNTTNGKSNDGHSNDKEEGEISETEETTPNSDGKTKTRSAKKSQSAPAKSLTKSMGEDLPHAKSNPKASQKASNTGKGPVGGTAVKKPFPKIQRRVPTKSELQLKKLKDNYLHFTNDLKQQMRKADASYAKSVATLTEFNRISREHAKSPLVKETVTRRRESAPLRGGNDPSLGQHPNKRRRVMEDPEVQYMGQTNHPNQCDARILINNSRMARGLPPTSTHTHTRPSAAAGSASQMDGNMPQNQFSRFQHKSSMDQARREAHDVISQVKASLQRNGEYHPVTGHCDCQGQGHSNFSEFRGNDPDSQTVQPDSLNDQPVSTCSRCSKQLVSCMCHHGGNPNPSQPMREGGRDQCPNKASNFQYVHKFPYSETEPMTMIDHLDKATIEKILSLEFVDLGTLLPPTIPELDKKNSKRVQWDKDQKDFVEVTDEKSLNNYTIWAKAFRIYMAVIIQKYPELAPQMLVYMSDIQRAAQSQSKFKISTWRQYDWVFRQAMAKYPFRRWDVIDQTHWSTYIVDKTAAARIENPSSNSNGYHGNGGNKNFKKSGNGNSNTPTKFCKDYNGINGSEGCKRERCRFKHSCSYCKKPRHPEFLCRNKKKDLENKKSAGQSNSGQSS